jgi:RNA polymerase sigma factor (sigma-70 family)
LAANRQGQDGAIWPFHNANKRGRSRVLMDNDFSDIELVDRLLCGEHGAFDLFYRRYERVVYHCIRRRADAADVDDIFQSFFERLMESDYRVLRLWQRRSSLTIYLSRVIRNFVVDFRRKKPPETPVEEVPEPPEPQGDETLETIILLKELRRLGLRAWAKLDGRDRLLVCGKFHRDLANEAMAERLNLTSGALRTALSRAQGRLLASLKTLAPEYFSA